MRRHQRAARVLSVIGAGVLAVCCLAGAEPTEQAWKTVRLVTDPPKMDPVLERRIRRLVDDLGGHSWRVRDKATRELIGIGSRAKPIVKEARKRPDLEVRTRAAQIIRAHESAEQDRSSVLADALGVLARAGEKGVIDAMLKLLDHEDGDIRYAAEYGLRRWTGERFGYRSEGDKTRRVEAAGKWRAWWKGARDKTSIPAASAARAEGVLVCLSQEVRLVTAEGKQIWSKKLAQRVYSAQLLANGNLITAVYNVVRKKDNRGSTVRYVVEERDPSGKVVWTNKTPVAQRVMDFERLANGNTLLVDMSARKVVEVDPSGTKVVWEYQSPGSVGSAQRLANGNTMVAVSSPGRIVEVDKHGKTVWSAGGFTYARHATKLPNGNVLLVDYSQKRVLEINRAGKTVWTWRSSGRGYPRSVCRLGSGATLVADSVDGLIVVNRQGKIVRRMPDLRGSSTGKLRPTRIPASLMKGAKNRK